VQMSAHSSAHSRAVLRKLTKTANAHPSECIRDCTKTYEFVFADVPNRTATFHDGC
jgi:hypothetical protein